ncbi:GNAT family N-acetyltransferase [Enterococcus wangshanyuanii]|uniref:Spermine/spermidine acetyltransferase n=1 Tax=Enterococcus wangshanyuanii TaxID=2005703 RepID=A0ABQ1PC90_9ENTE|nr:GNAT family N-acetyltransferase [Enterococcus wangshanyuanii]GGC94366.1 spermine/spermidine acetyltransferase [Enterococcus wangshanyuanii]
MKVEPVDAIKGSINAIYRIHEKIDTDKYKEKKGTNLMISLREVTNDNIEAVLNLKIKEEQQTFVASSCKSLAYAYVNKDNTVAFGIYMDNTLVGYASIIFDESDNMFNLWHFFISELFQGKGIGKQALGVVVEEIKGKSLGIANKVALGVEEENVVAIKLYESFGFKDTSERDEDGEIIMIYEF